MAITKQAAPARPQGINLNPESFTQGGLLDDVDVTIKEAAFTMWNYGGKIANMIPALGVSLVTEDGVEHDEYLSAGDAKYFVASEDGECLLPVGDKKGLVQTCNAAMFLASLVTAGFPADKLNEGLISVIAGTKVHVHREAVKRSGLKRTALPGQEPREQTVLVVDKIIGLPGGKAAAPGAKKAAPEAPAPAPSSGVDAGLANRTQEVIIGILSEGPTRKKDLAGKVFNAVDKTDPQRASILALAYKDDFLSAGPWTYENGTLSLG